MMSVANSGRRRGQECFSGEPRGYQMLRPETLCVRLWPRRKITGNPLIDTFLLRPGAAGGGGGGLGVKVYAHGETGPDDSITVWVHTEDPPFAPLAGFLSVSFRICSFPRSFHLF